MDAVKKTLTNLGIFSIIFAIFLFVTAILYLLFVVDLGSDGYVKLKKLCESVKRKGDTHDPNYEECTNLDYLLAAGFIAIFIACIQVGGAIAFGLVMASKWWPNWIAFHVFAGISCVVEVALIGLNHLGDESYWHVSKFDEKFDDRGLYIKLLIGACGADSGFCALGCIILGITALRQKIKEKEREEMEEEDRLHAIAEKERIENLKQNQVVEDEENFIITPEPIPTNFNLSAAEQNENDMNAQRNLRSLSNADGNGSTDASQNPQNSDIPTSLRSAPFHIFPMPNQQNKNSFTGTGTGTGAGTRRISPQKTSFPRDSNKRENYLPIPAAPYSDPGTTRSSKASSKYQPASAQPSKNYTYEPARGRIMTPPIPPPRPPSPHAERGSQRFSYSKEKEQRNPTTYRANNRNEPVPSTSRKQRRVSVARANVVESNNNNNNNNNTTQNQFYRPRGSVSAAPAVVSRNENHSSNNRRAASNSILMEPSSGNGRNQRSSGVNTVNFSTAPTTVFQSNSDVAPSSNVTSTHTHRYSSQ